MYYFIIIQPAIMVNSQTLGTIRLPAKYDNLSFCSPNKWKIKIKQKLAEENISRKKKKEKKILNKMKRPQNINIYCVDCREKQN